MSPVGRLVGPSEGDFTLYLVLSMCEGDVEKVGNIIDNYRKSYFFCSLSLSLSAVLLRCLMCETCLCVCGQMEMYLYRFCSARLF